jgi:hypothetical protein
MSYDPDAPRRKLTEEQLAAIKKRADELAETGGMIVGGDGWAAFVDGGPSAFHPYECQMGCNHCARKKTEHHDPETCAVCAEDGSDA